MFPSSRNPAKAAIGQPRPLAGEQQFIAAWLGHVQAGRIGTPTPMTPEHLATLRANEMAVLGHTPSFPDHPAPQPRRSGRGR